MIRGLRRIDDYHFVGRKLDVPCGIPGNEHLVDDLVIRNGHDIAWPPQVNDLAGIGNTSPGFQFDLNLRI